MSLVFHLSCCLRHDILFGAVTIACDQDADMSCSAQNSLLPRRRVTVNLSLNCRRKT